MSQKKCHAERNNFWLVMEIQRLCEEEGKSVKAACENMGVSRTNYRRWRDKLKANPEFMQRQEIPMVSRRPQHYARQLSASTREQVVEEAKKPHHTSANSITKALEIEGIQISPSTVIDILESEGLYGTISVKRKDGTEVRKRGLLRLCEKRHRTLRAVD